MLKLNSSIIGQENAYHGKITSHKESISGNSDSRGTALASHNNSSVIGRVSDSGKFTLSVIDRYINWVERKLIII